MTATEWQSDTCAVRDRPAHPLALPRLVAIDDRARNARHVVEDAALDKRVYARVAEQDQRCAIIIGARITRDLPSLREQLVDRERCLRCRQWTPLASLPRTGLSACTTLKPPVGFLNLTGSSLSKPKLALIFSNALICNRD